MTIVQTEDSQVGSLVADHYRIPQDAACLKMRERDQRILTISVIVRVVLVID